MGCHFDCMLVCTVGSLHYHGIPHYCKQDFTKAFQYYNLAAESGNKAAWKNVAAMYANGEGVPKSKETAMHILKVIFGQ
jgi:uncharacterized protein